MGKLALALCALMACAPAYADSHHGNTYDDYAYVPMSSPLYWGLFFVPVENEEHFGIVLYRNIVQHSELQLHNFTFETAYGDVTVLLYVTPNKACKDENCPDTVYVYRLPEGVRAEPTEITVDEEGKGEIKLFPYTGF